jgi:penicillin-binding protein 1A
MPPPSSDPRVRRLAWLASGATALAAILIGGRIALSAVLAAAEPPLPLGADLYALNRPASYTFLDKDGGIEGMRGAVVGDRLKLSEMPAYLPAAFLSMEDRRYYQHGGIDPHGLLRAAWADIKAGHVVEGGSTITQQVVKILFLTPDRTFDRKLTEIAGALELERHFSKNQILEIYLNRIYLGAGAYGVDGAARAYFGKSARNVTLAEAAMLAALTSSPSTYSPRRDLAGAQKRASLVLTEMVRYGAITPAQAAYARAHPATLVQQTDDPTSDYFLDAAADEVRKLVPSASGDLTIQTTLDPDLEDAARAAILKVLDKRGKAANASQAALVAMSTDGAVRALIGGRDYAKSAFNRATDAHRQPGSAFKPFVYLAALESGLAPDTVRDDEPITIGDWSPENFSDNYIGPVTLQDAFAESINSVAVALGQEVGLNSVIATARRLGITSPLAPNASLPLGTSEVTPLELTAAYTSFANVGYRAEPYFVSEISSPAIGVVYRHDNPERHVVIDQDNALLMNGLLYRVVQQGTGHGAAGPGHEVAGKTGTSDDFRDAWFVGFSPGMVAGVWVGNDDSSPMKKVTGGELPAQIWSGFMRVALKNVRWAPIPKTIIPDPPQLIVTADEIVNSDAHPNRSDGGGDFVTRTFHGVGRFFDHLFNGDDNAARRDLPPAANRRERTGFGRDDSGDDRYDDPRYGGAYGGRYADRAYDDPPPQRRDSRRYDGRRYGYPAYPPPPSRYAPLGPERYSYAPYP